MGYLSIASPVLLISWSIMNYAAGGVAVPTANVINSSLEPQLRQDRQARSCIQSTGWEEHGGNCFFFSSEKLPWEAAKRECSAITVSVRAFTQLAELGDPNNIGSDEWLMERIAIKGDRRWLGAHSPDNDTSSWNWVIQRRQLSLIFPFWGPTEPNNKEGNEYCVTTWEWEGQTPKRQYLADHPCDTEHHYVCHYQI